MGPASPKLRPVAVPAACQPHAPADGLQLSADAGHLPWRLDPAAVVLQCLRRGLGTADWRIRSIIRAINGSPSGSSFVAK